jgi:16S rRNA (cytosine967-C5)-methyltransferase
VLRRRPEARWRLAPSDVEALAARARGLLDRAAPLVRPGGRLVHATCSIEPEENEAQAEAFLLRHPGWRALPGFSVLPCAAHDGGFAIAFVAP